MMASLCTGIRCHARGTVNDHKIVISPGKTDNMQQNSYTRCSGWDMNRAQIRLEYWGDVYWLRILQTDNTDLLRLKICPSLTSRRRMEATASLVQRHSATTFTSSRCLHSSGLPSGRERHRVIFSSSRYIVTGVIKMNELQNMVL
jgi:hypothetical protein